MHGAYIREKKKKIVTKLSSIFHMFDKVSNNVSANGESEIFYINRTFSLLVIIN